MSSLDHLKLSILKQRSDIDKAKLLFLINEKKSKVGGGYLSDSGACWLVASDLGISLEETTGNNLTPNEVYVGANEVTVIGRIFAIYPAKEFSKKDKTKGKYQKLIIFDQHTFLKVILWDNKSNEFNKLVFQVNDNIKIIKGYIKSGFDDNLELNLGKQGLIEHVSIDNTNFFPLVESLNKEAFSVKHASSYLSIIGTVGDELKTSKFNRKDGSPGHVTFFHLINSKNEKIRIVIWNNNSKSLLNIQKDVEIRLINVKSKIINDNIIEFHGDESTLILPFKSTISQKINDKTKILRLISKGLINNDKKNSRSLTLLFINENNIFSTLIVQNDILSKLLTFKNDSLIQLRNYNLNENKLVKPTNFKVIIDDNSNINNSYKLVCKIRDISINKYFLFLKVITLSKTTTQNITTKNGLTIKKSEILIGDETGESKIIAWDNYTQILEKINPGERLLLRGLASQLENNKSISLHIKPYSNIEKL